mmetsp:Transcript_42547/g.35726  ORF Transcript_42547/g.35726 Transcript_42547/m.35726 type:complete len:104 (-) Transcript_42547:484-795(-)
MRLSLDDKTLYSVDENGLMNKWNIDTGKCTQTFEQGNSYQPIELMILSLDERTLFTLGPNNDENMEIKKWDIATGKCIQTFNVYDLIENSISCMNLSRDGITI